MSQPQTERVVDLARTAGVIRPRDLRALGLPRQALRRACQQGRLRKLGRGLYAAAETEFSEHQALAETSKLIPQGIICLLSALRYHDLTTQAPYEVWVAIPNKSIPPRAPATPVRVVRFSGPALTAGVDIVKIDAVSVRIYNPAKTIADCFKFRNKIGLDVALEALRDGLRQRRCTVDDLWHYAEICRVATVMRPYLEALT